MTSSGVWRVRHDDVSIWSTHAVITSQPNAAVPSTERMKPLNILLSISTCSDVNV